jgi:hypothetical protein
MKIGNINILIGSDPEAFVRHKNTKQIVSAIPLIPESKENKVDCGDGFTLYHDNVAVEGTIPPAETKEQFIGNINKLISLIHDKIGEDYEVAPVASHNFAEDQLKDDDAMQIGCSPFYLSHSLEIAEPPTLPDGYRSAGFHIHIGREDFKNPSCDFIIDPMSKVKLINNLDLFVGIPSVLFDNSPESKSRKGIYTQSAGSHRPCQYGVEYRPLSSNCMRSQELMEFIYDCTMLGIENTIKNTDFSHIDEQLVVDTINNHDVNSAKSLVGQILSQEYLNRLESFIIH